MGTTVRINLKDIFGDGYKRALTFRAVESPSVHGDALVLSDRFVVPVDKDGLAVVELNPGNYVIKTGVLGSLDKISIGVPGDGLTYDLVDLIDEGVVPANPPARQGPPGPGVATGGAAGQALFKVDGANYNTRWESIGTAARVDVPASGNAASDQAVKGNDSRLTNARTPTGHAGSHYKGGGDPIKLTDIATAGTDYLKPDGVANSARSLSSDDASFVWEEDVWSTNAPIVATEFIGNGSGLVGDADDLQAGRAINAYRLSAEIGNSGGSFFIANDGNPLNLPFWYSNRVIRADGFQGPLNADDLNKGTVSESRGGAGVINGLTKANGLGVMSQAVAGTDYLHPSGSGASLTGLTKSKVGLPNVDDTSDANKPISAATATALAAKEPTQTAASQSEAEAGIGTSIRSWTPQRIGQAISKLAVGFLRAATNTWTGVNTFSSNVVLNGTNNTAPGNSTYRDLPSGSSIATKNNLTRQALLNGPMNRTLYPKSLKLVAGATGQIYGDSADIECLPWPNTGSVPTFAGVILISNPTNPSSGAGHNFSLPITFSGCFFGGVPRNNGVSRFTVGGVNAAIYSDQDALTDKGFGFEFRGNLDGGVGPQVRIFKHDGTSYVTSAWIEVPIDGYDFEHSYSFLIYKSAPPFNLISLWVSPFRGSYGRVIVSGTPLATLTGAPIGATSVGTSRDISVSVATPSTGGDYQYLRLVTSAFSLDPFE